MGVQIRRRVSASHGAGERPEGWALRRARRGIAGTAAIALGALGGGGLAVSQAAHAEAAAPQVLTVTTNLDTPFGDPTTPGSLRAAFAEVEAASQAAAEPTAFEIQIQPGIGDIALVDYLELEVGEQTQSLSITGAAGGDSVLDLADNGVYLRASAGVDAFAVADLTVQNGMGFEAREMESTAGSWSNVTFDRVESVRLGGTAQDTITGVTATDSRVNLEVGVENGQSVPGEYALTLSDSSFTNTPLGVDAHASVSNTLELSDLTLTDAPEQAALTVMNGGGADVRLSLADSHISGAGYGAISTQRVSTVTLERTEITQNEGDAIVSVSADETRRSSLVLRDMVVADNESYDGAVLITGPVADFTVEGSRFTGNSAINSAGAIQANQNAASDYTDHTFAVTGSLFEGNSSTGQGAGAISAPGWFATPDGAGLTVRDSTFRANTSASTAADLALVSVQSSEGDARLEITGSTFADPAGNAETGRSVSMLDLLGARVSVENSTFSGSDDGAPFLGVGFFGDESQLALTHNTFVGGGVRVAQALPGAADAIVVRGTAFDAPADPLEVVVGETPVQHEATVTRTASELLPGAVSATSAEFALSALGEHGGPTPTHLPAGDSVLVDAAGTAPVAADQRGVSRPQGAAADVGAVERAVGVVALVADLTVVEGEDAVLPVVRDAPDVPELAGPASATLEATDGSAVRDTDFTFTDGTVEFAAGAGDAAAAAAQPGTLTVPTIDRAGTQGPRTFTVAVAAVADGDVVGSPERVTVTITDRDEGTTDGTTEGTTEGTTDGATDGTTDGATDGSTDGATDGTTDGGPTPGTTGGTGGALATTGGSSAVWPALLGGAALLLGAALLMGRRARRSTDA